MDCACARVGPGVEEDRPRYGGTENNPSHMEFFVSWPGIGVWILREEIIQWHPWMHETLPTTMYTEASQRHSRRSICQAQNRGSQPAAVPRRSHVTISNISAESQPVQSALLQYLYLSITPHQYLVLGEGGKQGKQGKELLCRQLYTALCMHHCIYHYQSSGTMCLDLVTVCICSTTNHFLRPSPVLHASFRRWMVGEKTYFLAPSFTLYTQI